MSLLRNTFFRYLPVSARDKEWGLYVPTVGYSWTEAHPRSYPLAQHPPQYHFQWKNGRILQEFQVLYIVRGEGIFESAAAGKQPIKAGDAFILFPGVWHRYAPNPDTGWDEYWVGFDGEIPRNLVRKRCFSSADPVFSIGVTESSHDLFSRVIEMLEMEPPGYAQMLAGMAFQILARLNASGCAEKVGGDFNETIIRKAKYLIMERFAQKLDWEFLARDLHVSYSWLRHTFRQHTGFSLHQYQLQIRLNKAKSLLNETAFPVKEIAFQLGFDCQYHFSHLFKRKTGFSPEVWRRDARGGGWTDRRSTNPKFSTDSIG